MTERQAPTVRQVLAELVAAINYDPLVEGVVYSQPEWNALVNAKVMRLSNAITAAREILSHPEPDRAALVERLNVYVAALLYDSGGENDDEVQLIREAAAALESAVPREWIPVGTPPQENGRYHIFCRHWPDEVPQADFRDGRWFAVTDSFEFGESFEITHYRFLPPPP